MSPIEELKKKLTIPVIASPMFIVSGPELVIEQCKAGIVGSFPALNARPTSQFDEWLIRINKELEEFKEKNPGKKVAPYAVNQIVHKTNPRLNEDMEICIKHKVPIIITSLNSPKDVVKKVHSYGGLVFHDVTNLKHAQNAIDAGVDGLILVCVGAGGHAGTTSPFALVSEIRRIYQGPLILSGAIATGKAILSAIALGADFAYIGTRFIATKEANAPDGYKSMIVSSSSSDIVYTPYFSGIPGNYLKHSITASGLDPNNLPAADKTKMNFDQEQKAGPKAWKEIWGAGQGCGAIDDVSLTCVVVERLKNEYEEAKARISKL